MTSIDKREAAEIQYSLGLAYSIFPGGDQQANLKKAITYFQETLRSLAPEDSPSRWAATQHELGTAYRSLSSGKQQIKLKKAITCYQAALRVYTLATFPVIWALIQQDLGSIYSALPDGNQQANLEKAIAYFQSALRVYTFETFPTEWIATQHDLGAAQARFTSSIMSSVRASDIQQRMYKFIVSYMKSEKMPPTNREIGHELQIGATGHVNYHLSMLEKKGLISRQPKKSRGIKLMKPATGIPVMGSIAAGQPLEISSDPEEIINVGRDLEHGNTYALIVKGRSMIEDHICDGDYVVIKPQTTCNNGDIVVATHLQQGESGGATLKRFFQEKEHDRIRLQPANSELEPIFVPKSEWDQEWSVQGKVIAIFRMCPAG